MHIKTPDSRYLSARSLPELIPPEESLTIGLTTASLEGSADFSNSYTMASIAAWVRRVRPRVRMVYSTNVEDLLKCDHVWCTSLSESWDEINKLGKTIVDAGKTFVVGGHHATALPETLKYGLAFRGPIESYKSVDELPLPDWSIFTEEKAYPVIMTSRGCPYSCHFCSSRNFWKGWQAKRPETVVAEVNALKALDATTISIFDDLLITSKTRLRRIVDLINAEGLNRLRFSCLVRSNLIDSQTIGLLKEMNVRSLAFGAESGSDRVLRLMNKQATVEDNQRAIDLLNEYGYRPTLSFVLGYPEETEEDLNQTVDFVTKNRAKCDIIELYPCIPLPGTPLWTRFVQEHRVDVHAFDWEGLSIRSQAKDWDKYVMLTSNYSKDRLISVIQWNEREKEKRLARASLRHRLLAGIKGTVSKLWKR
jgi:uncharacterized radical SAM superfamily protein